MLIHVNVKTRSKRPGVSHLTGSVYEVRVNEAPIEGRANVAVIDALAKYFQLKKNQFQIISGLTSSTKAISIE